MMLRLCLTGCLVLAIMMPAMAFQCPTDIAKIDAALAANRSLDPNIRNVIQTLRDTATPGAYQQARISPAEGANCYGAA